MSAWADLPRDWKAHRQVVQSSLGRTVTIRCQSTPWRRLQTTKTVPAIGWAERNKLRRSQRLVAVITRSPTHSLSTEGYGLSLSLNSIVRIIFERHLQIALLGAHPNVLYLAIPVVLLQWLLPRKISTYENWRCWLKRRLCLEL